MYLLYNCVNGDVYLDDKGYIRVIPHKYTNFHETELMEATFRECGYKRYDPIRAYNIVRYFNGKSFDELKDELRRRSEAREKHREKANEYIVRWRKQCENFSDVPIGIDRHIDDFETGFSVFVLMNSKYTRKEQADFIRNRRKEFIAFVVQEIKRLRKKKYADLLPFCRISEITVTNRNEAVVTFELKEKLQDVLKAVD